MKIDLNLTITAVIALAAIISPIAVSIINNRHQRKLYTLQYREQKRHEIIDQYLTLLGYFVVNDTVSWGDVQKLAELSGKIYAYIPVECWEYADSVSEYIRSRKDCSGVKAGYFDFCKTLANQKTDTPTHKRTNTHHNK